MLVLASNSSVSPIPCIRLFFVVKKKLVLILLARPFHSQALTLTFGNLLEQQAGHGLYYYKKNIFDCGVLVKLVSFSCARVRAGLCRCHRYCTASGPKTKIVDQNILIIQNVPKLFCSFIMYLRSTSIKRILLYYSSKQINDLYFKIRSFL